MKHSIIILVVSALALCSFKPIDNDQKEPLIQIALLLDTSGSMDGLIEQAKSQLWKMVNELVLTDYDGESPMIELALYEYGKSTVPTSEGHVKQLVALSSDLDLVSEALFALSTNGGEEYCGRAIETSLKDLKWSEDNDDLKIIFIAGNEGFNQGLVHYNDACKAAISKGIIVNTIFCGNNQKGIQLFWKDGADIADGQYMNIDHNQVVAQIATPFDKEIAELNGQLNKTYLWYGSDAESKRTNQVAQDQNADAYSPAMATERAISKSNKMYKQAAFDLVDALEENEAALEEIEEEALPKDLVGLSTEEQKNKVNEMATERANIQKKINSLGLERKNFIDNNQVEGDSNSLDKAMVKMVKEQYSNRKCWNKDHK